MPCNALERIILKRPCSRFQFQLQSEQNTLALQQIQKKMKIYLTVVSVPPKFGPFYIVGRSLSIAGRVDGLSVHRRLFRRV